MSPSIEEIYQKLLEYGISEKELEKEIHKKAKEYGGFMSKQGILFIIAKEYGINIYSPEIETELYQKEENGIDYDEFSIPITDVKEGMINIVLLGKILKTFTPREFLRKDNSVGVVSSCIIGDSSGEIKVVMWDDKTIIMKSESFKEGQLVRVLGDYSKVNKDGNIEVHVGKKGKIILAPEDIDLHTKQQLEKVTNIQNQNTIQSENNRMSINILINKYSFIKKMQGEIHIEEFKEITKKNGERTFLLKLILSDDTDSIRVNIWDMYAIEAIKIIEEGSCVILRNIAVKINLYTNEKEIYFTKKSSMEVL